MNKCQECDFDMRKVDEVLKNKTKEQLDKEWEDFKKQFEKENCNK